MAFPGDEGTLHVYDNFNAADTSSIIGRTASGGDDWDSILYDTGEAVEIDGNLAKDFDTTNFFSTAISTETHTDAEMYGTIGGTFKGGLFMRIADGGTASPDCYTVYLQQDIDFIAIYRLDNGAYSSALDSDSGTYTPEDGDLFGMTVSGTTISGHLKEGAGAWTTAVSATDSTYSAAGAIGISLDTKDATLDDLYVTQLTTDHLGTFLAAENDSAAIDGSLGIGGDFLAAENDAAAIDGSLGAQGAFSAAEQDAASIDGSLGIMGVFTAAETDETTIAGLVGIAGLFLAAEQDSASIDGSLGIAGAFLAAEVDEVLIIGDSAPAVPGFPGTVETRDYLAGTVALNEITGGLTIRDYVDTMTDS